MASSDSEIDKPQRGRWAELPDVNIKTGTQSINTDKFIVGHFMWVQKEENNSFLEEVH